jgi:GH25 family lysozyme M1 (1,4-beta-N-acetylmuramidase)
MSSRVWPLGAGRIVTSEFGPRWGGYHYGIDLGADGGSGGLPVYAAQGGFVDMVGPARGFGQWVVVDHPDGDGAGTTVYGHVIPEVGLHQRVEAGQRIAHINPDPATNGGVPPHLHFEVHPTVWAAGSQIDPIAWLAGAGEPDQRPTPPPPPPPPAAVTTFGVDISNHQAGLDLGRVFAEGFEYVIAKVSEGDYFRDRAWPGFRDATLAAGKVLVGYHYVTEDAAAIQADLLMSHLGDPSIPIMLDVEANSGGADNVRAVRDAIEARGGRVRLLYLPRWYWDRIGQPDLTGLPPLMSSDYGPGRAGYASAIYPGPGDRGWLPYGGLDVAVFQFSEKGAVAGTALDVDAFRGSPDDLRRLLNGDDEMSLTPEQDTMLRTVYAELTKRFPSRSELRADDEDVDTLAGFILNIDGRVHEESIQLPQQLAALQQSINDLPGRIAAALRSVSR